MANGVWSSTSRGPRRAPSPPRPRRMRPSRAGRRPPASPLASGSAARHSGAVAPQRRARAPDARARRVGAPGWASMPITLVTGPANSGKAQVLMDAVRRQLAHGQEPLLIVPTRADVEHYLRELAGEQAAMGVRVERFAGLIAEAVRRAGISDAVLAGLARERLLAALAARAG